MCGIVGFTGKRQAASILLDGLSKLEYRGYDSAGMAVRDGENLAEVVKAKGRLSALEEKTDNGNVIKGTCGIGHTRWATADFITYIPRVDEHFMGSLAVIPLQLLGYYISIARGLDVDKPRNLAKSVTLE